MSVQRIFKSSEFLQPSEGEPIRSVVTQTSETTIVAWHVNPGQTIKAHIHPSGQDTWTILAGQGDYFLDGQGASKRVSAGDVVIAHSREVHGVHNAGHEPLVFISVVSPADAGYELLPE